VDAGGVDDRVHRQRASGCQKDRPDDGAGRVEAGHAVGEEPSTGGIGLPPEDGEEHLRVQPAVAAGQDASDEVVGHEAGIALREVVPLQPLGRDPAPLVGLEVPGQRVDVLGPDDEQVAVGAPAQLWRRAAVDGAPGLPVLDHIEHVPRHLDVLGPGEQLPDAAGALAGGGPAVGVVGLDDHDVEAGIGGLKVQGGGAADCSRPDDEDRAHVHVLRV
jgi:hypothetical protein